jgi:predicted RNA binding protein YcfA (HicA-like mRNA interferase family)
LHRLPVISGQEALKAFEKAGWQHVRNKGDHMIMTKSHLPYNLSIPHHRELDRGLLRGLIRDAGLTVEEFVRLL